MMVLLLVSAAFIVYDLVVIAAGWWWRRRGLQFLEYIAGAVIVVQLARYQLELTPSADWYTVVVAHYGVAALFVIPMEVGLALWGWWQGEQQKRADEASHA